MVKKKVESEEMTYPLNTLRDNCKAIFNIEREIFDGVFYGSSLEEEVTKEEVQNKINEWLRKEV